jgi:hypothetical protein
MANQREYLRQAMRLAEQYAGSSDPFKWTVEVLLTLEDFLRTAAPAEVDRLQALHRAGLIDFGGLFGNWFPLADVQILTETLRIAVRLRREYGFEINFGLNCDVTGLPWGLVELLLDSGFHGLVMAMNRTMARDPQPRPRGFWWAGPSGRKLLTWHGEHYGLGQHFGIPRVKTSAGWVVDLDASISKLHGYLGGLEARSYPYDFALLQITSTFLYDNGGPHEDLVRFVREWNDRGLEPRLRQATLAEFFTRLKQEPGLPEQSGDWTEWWTQGLASASFETSIARQTHPRLQAARSLGALLGGLQAPFVPDARTDEQAWRSLAFFDEHTWGMDESVTHPGSPNTRGALNYKYNLAYGAAAAVTRLSQTALRDLAARLPQNSDPHVVVFNSLPWARRVPLYLPRVSSTSWALPNLERSLELAAPQSGTTLGVDYGLVELPAGGYATLPLRTAGPVSAQPTFALDGMADVKTPDFIPAVAPGLAPSTAITSNGWTLENRFYSLRIDPSSGAIASLTSKADGHEWVDASTPWRLAHYIYETNRSPRGRRDMQVTMESQPDYDHRPLLKPQRRGPEAVRECRFVPGVGKARLALQLDAPGANDVRFQVVLYEDEPWIDLIFDIDKKPETKPESVYVAFPLALQNPTAHYDIPGAGVEAETEQLPYANRDFYYIQSWADLNDGQHGCTLVSPEAPLVHFGGFSNHSYRPQLTMEQPYLVSWLMNNHWMTAYPASQQSWLRFTYRMVPRLGGYDPAQTAHIAAETVTPPLCAPLIDRPAGLLERAYPFAPHLPVNASLFSLQPAGVQVVGMRSLEDNLGVELHLQEVTGQVCEVQLTFPEVEAIAARVVDLTGQILSHPEIKGHKIFSQINPRRQQIIQVFFPPHTKEV